MKHSKREVAVLLSEQPPKEEKALIRAEALIRDDHLIEALEIIQLSLELLHERIKLIEYSKECPPDLVSVISTVIWSSHRVDINELLLIRQQFRAKYGAKFEENAMRNTNSCLNERVVSRLSIEPPAAYLVQRYLVEICEEYNVDYTSSIQLTASNMIEPMQAPTGYSVPAGQGTGFGPIMLNAASTGMTLTEAEEHRLKQQQQQFFAPLNAQQQQQINGSINGIPIVVAKPYVPNYGNSSPSSTITSTPKTVAAGICGGFQNNAMNLQQHQMMNGIQGTQDVGSVTVFPPSIQNESEPEIVVPSDPFQQQTKHNNDEDDGNDSNNNNQPPPPPSTSNNGNAKPSYSDLAARFELLNKT